MFSRKYTIPTVLTGNLSVNLDDAMEMLLIRADYFVQTGDLEHAMECYNTALKQQLECYDAWIGVGVVHLKQERLPDAEVAFMRALLIRPDGMRASIGMALVHFEHGNLKEAVTMLRNARNED